MTTRDIARRFKASEALQFFEDQVIPLTFKRLLLFAAPEPYPSLPYDYYDRWEYLDSEFVEEWTDYRELPVPGVCAAPQERSFSTSSNPSSECNDTLDSVLRTSLWLDDPKFYQLACRRVAWWDSDRIRLWLLEKSYTLYLRYPSEEDYADGMYPVYPEHNEYIFPFAHHQGRESDSSDGKFPPALYGNTGCVGNIAFAQNTSGQHVAVKAVLDGSEEFRILKYLHNQGVPQSMDDFHHVIPVLDLLHCEGHWLAFMPRYASTAIGSRLIEQLGN
ncbi:hypothetical protein C0995_012382 [Termitomyces sp. Mi166|nr:hypothetical protein C0995_012382 [Termitomyces sp. Mi166\